MAVGEGISRLMGKLLAGVHANEEDLLSHDLATKTSRRLSVSSPAFAAGGSIPARYSQYGENLSPPLVIGDVPSDVKSLVLVCEDPDAPKADPFVHWILYNLSPQTREVPENVPTTALLPNLGKAGQGKNSAGKIGFAGTKPPPGHGLHHYHFQVFGLDKELGFTEPPTKEQVLETIAGHVTAEGEVVGTYEKA